MSAAQEEIFGPVVSVNGFVTPRPKRLKSPKGCSAIWQLGGGATLRRCEPLDHGFPEFKNFLVLRVKCRAPLLSINDTLVNLWF